MSHENLRGVRGAFGRGVLRGKILPHKRRRADGNGDYAGVGIEGQISRKVRLYVLRGPATDTKKCTTVAARSRMMQTAGPWGLLRGRVRNGAARATKRFIQSAS